MAAPKTLSQVFFNHLTKLSIQGNRRSCGKLEKTPRMQLYVSFNPADNTTVAAAITAMENSIRDVRAQMRKKKFNQTFKRINVITFPYWQTQNWGRLHKRSIPQSLFRSEPWTFQQYAIIISTQFYIIELNSYYSSEHETLLVTSEVL